MRENLKLYFWGENPHSSPPLPCSLWQAAQAVVGTAEGTPHPSAELAGVPEARSVGHLGGSRKAREHESAAYTLVRNSWLAVSEGCSGTQLCWGFHSLSCIAGSRPSTSSPLRLEPTGLCCLPPGLGLGASSQPGLQSMAWLQEAQTERKHCWS